MAVDGLIFEDFIVDTSAGSVLFEDIARLRAEGLDLLINQIEEWKVDFTELVSQYEGFFQCPTHGEELNDLFQRRTKKFKADVREGRRDNFPKEVEFRESTHQEEQNLNTRHRQDFPNHAFRLSIDGVFFGVWMHSSNVILSRVDDLVELKTFPGPCMNNFEHDTDEWHVVMGEIITEFVRKLEFVAVGEEFPTAYRFSRIEFPDRVWLAGSTKVVDALATRGMDIQVYQPRQGDVGPRLKAATESPGSSVQRRVVSLREQ